MKKLILQVFLSLVVALAFSSFAQAHCGHCGVGDDAATNGGAGKSQVWTCPMHSDVHMDKPGKCPQCGMDLVPAK
ncbi:MAG: heavy metal-binding domain-containing protein [Chthoniobacterales bacterium]|jgi:hypothetical protein